LTIFVAIPAYRDSELVPTVLQALAAASAPQDLRFGICWQRAGGDSLGPLAGQPQIRVVERDYRDARGLGWARSLATTLYDGEDYFLQIDSHMRFVRGWDERMIAELGRAPSEKPLLSTWAAHYRPEEPPVAGPPVRMRFEAWDDSGGLRFDCAPILDYQTRTEPVLTGFVCGHFLFAAGSFLAEVPNDPYIYFYGEEINTAVRAFTWGWDAYAPAQHLLWHHWGRTKSRIRHWEDHGDPADRHPWQLMERQSRRRLRAFLREPPIGRLGCGVVRSYDEYQALVGLDLRTRSGLVSDGAGRGP
jgi:glycosyltransferase involved in cell wall biosynthesis